MDQDIPAGVVTALLDYRAKTVRARASFVAHCVASTAGKKDEAERTDVIRQRDTTEMMMARQSLELAIEVWSGR